VALSTHRWHSHLLLSGSLILIIASLFWARVVVIPIVLAVLLTFILSPLVNMWEKIGLNRVCATAVTVSLALLLFAGIGLTMLMEIKSLATDLPDYQEQITAKIVSIRDAGKGSWLEDVLAMIQDISRTLESQAKGNEPMPVTVETSRLPVLQSAAISLLDLLVSIGLVTVLVGAITIQYPGRGRLRFRTGNRQPQPGARGMAVKEVERWLAANLAYEAE